MSDDDSGDEGSKTETVDPEDDAAEAGDSGDDTAETVDPEDDAAEAGDGDDHGAALRRWGRKSAYAGLTVFAVLMVILVGLYLLSFHAPVAADERPVDYDGDPGAALANATLNLRLDAYGYQIRANESLPDGETRPLFEQRLVVNNPAQLYSTTVRTGVLLRNRSYRPALGYGTIATGHTRRPPDVGTIISRGDGSWNKDDSHAYAVEARNVFTRPGRLADAEVRVESNTDDRFVARVENRTLATEVGYPRSLDRDGDWTASLTVTVAKGADRTERAVFRYENQTSGRTVRAVYEIDRGAAPHRPLATYPPGLRTVFFRIDRGVATLDRLWPLTGGVIP